MLVIDYKVVPIVKLMNSNEKRFIIIFFHRILHVKSFSPRSAFTASIVLAYFTHAQLFCERTNKIESNSRLDINHRYYSHVDIYVLFLANGIFH